MPLGRSKSPGPRRSPTGIDSKDVAAETASDPLSAKGKISERLTKKVDSTPPTKNRSPDLIPLTAEYEQFKKKLRALVTTIKKYADTMEKMNASRDQVRILSICTSPRIGT